MAALYFVVVATIAAFVGQHVVRKLIILLGRASLIIFILAVTILISAILLGELLVSYHLVYRNPYTSKYVNLNSEIFFLSVRWGWHIKHDWEDSAARLHGI